MSSPRSNLASKSAVRIDFGLRFFVALIDVDFVLSGGYTFSVFFPYSGIGTQSPAGRR